ncbi:glutathione S-transferase C-terminal domain-containing protein [Kitasatospora sp. NPDC085879]|uniref:glutathione S-transferase C-terminal domain-containing protein n=1 Tax=Kitasatospora sp. NPDC085879 TaxID=3154769 RepID=UPI003432A22C
MPEILPSASGPAVLCRPETPAATPDAPAAPGPAVRNRIGTDRAGGFYPAPHRYQIYLCPDCPRSLRVAITLDLLDLADSVGAVLLTAPAAPAPEGRDGHAALHLAYQATVHRYDGPPTVPALCDRWTGRIVSNHTPDILRDLAEHLCDRGRPDLPELWPTALAAEIDAVRHLLDTDLAEGTPETVLAALDGFDRRLGAGPYVLGETLTAADVDLWVALVRLDAVDALLHGTETAVAPARFDRLRAYVRRLHRHPAFRGGLHTDRPGTPPCRLCAAAEGPAAADAA